MNEAAATADKLEETRQLYKPLSRRGSLLYLALCDLSRLNPFYQWSLEAFKAQLQATLVNCQDAKESRRETLKDALTWEVYCNTCMGLLGCHRLVFAFMVAKAIDTQAGNVPQTALEFLLRGAAEDELESISVTQVRVL